MVDDDSYCPYSDSDRDHLLTQHAKMHGKRLSAALACYQAGEFREAQVILANVHPSQPGVQELLTAMKVPSQT